MEQTVLIVEDEERIAHWIQAYFEKEGYKTIMAQDGDTGLYLARTKYPDLVILDLMLPGMNGTELCKELRHESDVPIIMVTARSEESDRITGLELGADDYIVKPFSPGELVARAKAVLRRVEGNVRQAKILQGGNIELNLTDHTCSVEGESVKLSKIQFALLEVLMRNPGRAMTREQLLDGAFSDDLDVLDRTIDVHIRRLRRQVEANPANPRYIVTVFGIGYKFVT
ncbi:response regulator transcription factor [Anaerolineales bacterium HSG24]|nr:response regulator transcription factor [Anaerolineales bacterium HSG24]